MSLRYRGAYILRNGRRDWPLGRGAAGVMRLHSAGGDESASAGLRAGKASRAGGLRAEDACRRGESTRRRPSPVRVAARSSERYFCGRRKTRGRIRLTLSLSKCTQFNRVLQRRSNFLVVSSEVPLLTVSQERFVYFRPGTSRNMLTTSHPA
jgi:hypothetical protein